mgnify:CR=1 FL=1
MNNTQLIAFLQEALETYTTSSTYSTVDAFLDRYGEVTPDVQRELQRFAEFFCEDCMIYDGRIFKAV